MPKTFAPGDFLKALSEGGLREPILKTGMVKQDESSPDALLFSEGGSCASWTKIPLDLIEQIEFIRTVRCRDHEHPLVRLHLKEPDPANTVAAVFAALVKAAPSQQVPSAVPLRETRHRGSDVGARHPKAARALGTYYGASGIAHCGNGQFLRCGVACNYDTAGGAIVAVERDADYTCYNRGDLLSLNDVETWDCS